MAILAVISQDSRNGVSLNQLHHEQDAHATRRVDLPMDFDRRGDRSMAILAVISQDSRNGVSLIQLHHEQDAHPGRGLASCDLIQFRSSIYAEGVAARAWGQFAEPQRGRTPP
jgi:hypothetical protein